MGETSAWPCMQVNTLMHTQKLRGSAGLTVPADLPHFGRCWPAYSEYHSVSYSHRKISTCVFQITSRKNGFRGRNSKITRQDEGRLRRALRQSLSRLTDKPVFRQRTGLMMAVIDQTRDGDSPVFIQVLVGQSAARGKTHRWFLATATTTTSRYHT